MSRTIDASKLLRPALLDGVSVLVAATPALSPDGAGRPIEEEDSYARAVVATCAGLGAAVSTWRPDDAVGVDVDLLVVDAAALFALHAVSAGDGEAGSGMRRDALRACLDGAWEVTKAVASAAFIDADRPGRIVYVSPACTTTPRSSSGASSAQDRAPLAGYAGAACAGLENLSRTLSIEWARYGVTTVTIAPGEHTSNREVAALTAYLGSPAGAYFSGCLLDLRGA